MRTAIALDGSEYETDAPEVVEVVKAVVEVEDVDYSEEDNNDGRTQEEVESCRDWGNPYDTESGVPFQLQEDFLEFGD
jgi:hypothetical protein